MACVTIVMVLVLSQARSFSVDDILNADYLPGGGIVEDESVSSNATWNEAISTMSFHRTMMNEYLCRSYVAADIVQSLATGHAAPAAQDRLGVPKQDPRSIQGNLMDDEGSSTYKNWLSRSTTLEDIYRHFEGIKAAEDAPVPQTVPVGGSYDGGQVTGYAMMGGKVADSGHSGYGMGTSYGVPEYSSPVKSGGDEKGMKLKELLHLALTGVAFLAFKMFLIEVIMCLFDKETDSTMTMVLPTLIPGAQFKLDQETLTTEYPEIREKRSINVENFNGMAAKVLATIESLAVVHEDGGQCLRRTICDANKYARSLHGAQRIWLPLWSFGVSWISGRLGTNWNSRRRPYEYFSPKLLGHLKAVALGFAGTDCSYHYPDCNGVGRNSRRKRSV